MTIISECELIRVLRFAPDGLTTAQAAERLPGAKFQTVSSRLAKLHSYGKIDREFIRRTTPGAGPSRWSIWKLPQPAATERQHLEKYQRDLVSA